MLKAVVVGAKNNLANQTFMSYDMTLIDYMKDRIPKNVLWKLPSTALKIPKKSAIFYYSTRGKIKTKDVRFNFCCHILYCTFFPRGLRDSKNIGF